MKRTLASLLLLAAASALHGQWTQLDSQEFSGIGDTGVAVHGYIQFWQNDSTPETGEIRLYVDNFAVYQFVDSTPTGFENGIITGFGFDVGTGFDWTTSFTESDPATAIAGMAPAGSTDAIHFEPEEPYFNSGVSMDIGGDSTSPSIPANGLAGGYRTLFTFGFKASDDTEAFFTANFNAEYFFAPPDDLDEEDLFFRFQSVSSGGQREGNSDKVFVTWDPGGGGFDNPVPEPSTYGLFGAMALLALVIARRRKAG